MCAHEKIRPKLYDLDQEKLSSVRPLPRPRPQVLSSTSALLSTPLSSPMSWNTSTRARASERRLNSSLIHPRAGKRATPKKCESTNCPRILYSCGAHVFTQTYASPSQETSPQPMKIPLPYSPPTDSSSYVVLHISTPPSSPGFPIRNLSPNLSHLRSPPPHSLRLPFTSPSR